MKFYKYLALLAVLSLYHMSTGDTLSLVGGTSGNYALGWQGEGYVNGHWCGDTLSLDKSPDTTISTPDTIKNYFVLDPINDTVTTTKSTIVQDSLTITTTIIHTTKILRDSANDSTVDIVTFDKTVIDSDAIISCSSSTFLTDKGGPTEGDTYFNFTYKFRNWYAQIPFVFKGWKGLDSSTIGGYKDLLITYKGILPTHKVSLSFFYGSWGVTDSMANKLGRGDGVGTLEPSDTWKTVVIHIPDSVQLYAIGGITLGIGNGPGVDSGKVSDVGNLKVYQISLVTPDTSSIKRITQGHIIRQDQSFFTPKIKGELKISVYSLNGAILGSKTMTVDPSKRYSIRQSAELQSGVSLGQMRIVKIQGAGVDLIAKVR